MYGWMKILMRCFFVHRTFYVHRISIFLFIYIYIYIIKVDVYVCVCMDGCMYIENIDIVIYRLFFL